MSDVSGRVNQTRSSIDSMKREPVCEKHLSGGAKMCSVFPLQSTKQFENRILAQNSSSILLNNLQNFLKKNAIKPIAWMFLNLRPLVNNTN